MVPFTYDRLLVRLNALYDSIPAHIRGPGGPKRIADLQQAINAGIVAAEAGRDGEAGIPKPSQLKRDVAAAIDDVNERHDLLPATVEDREAAETLLGMASAAQPANPFRSTNSGVEFLDIPPAVVDLARFDKEIFLAGVQFAMQNFTATHTAAQCGHADDGFAERCLAYVRHELVLKEQAAVEATRRIVRIVEETAKG
ncbi:hypothetical protein N0V83_006828 [Neocucurbitaria cava]|uniref:Uncharacterized protein n=1 Tax=Neocucurbitaria cava TaxID=798079 RepID=A0A9W8Y8S2_9PLEO|nr:hypothetical protein N0V83_006828 [Neocucurbitaria cava]